MKSNRRSRTKRKSRRIHHVRRWLLRRRHVMMTSALRGACYGAGTGAVGLLIWWLERYS